MLSITIPETEIFNEETQEFITIKKTNLTLEYSLVAISKWESKWKKPFLTENKKDKTNEQVIDYIRCMTLDKNVDPEVYNRLTKADISKINAYIDDPMSATWFSKNEKFNGINKRTITSELIYYWMIALNIPFECQKWHLNRLITLIRVCNAEAQVDPKSRKLTQEELQFRAKLNAERRAKMKTKG